MNIHTLPRAMYTRDSAWAQSSAETFCFGGVSPNFKHMSSPSFVWAVLPPPHLSRRVIGFAHSPGLEWLPLVAAAMAVDDASFASTNKSDCESFTLHGNFFSGKFLPTPQCHR